MAVAAKAKSASGKGQVSLQNREELKETDKVRGGELEKSLHRRKTLCGSTWKAN